MTKNQLAIDINFSAVRFVKLSGDFVLAEKTFAFTDKQDYRFKQQLDEFWKSTEWKESDFDEVTLSWSGGQTTLTPVNVFNESSKEAIFDLTFGNQFQHDEIDYNRLPIQGIVNVYAVPMWVKSFFVLRFPRIVMQHEGTHLIRGVFAGQTFKLKTKIVLHETHFVIAVVKENNLKFYSIFEWNTLEDIVYYYTYSLQQLNYSEEVNDLEISLGAGAMTDLESLKSTLESFHKEKIAIQISNHLVEKYQQLCV